MCWSLLNICYSQFFNVILKKWNRYHLLRVTSHSQKKNKIKIKIPFQINPPWFNCLNQKHYYYVICTSWNHLFINSMTSEVIQSASLIILLTTICDVFNQLTVQALVNGGAKLPRLVVIIKKEKILVFSAPWVSKINVNK